MPVKLSAVRTRSLPPIPLGDGDLAITYFRPTAEYADTASAALENAGKSAQKTISAFLLPLIAGWDLLDDEGTPLPINEGNLLLLPQDVLLQIQTMINEQETPEKNEPMPSAPSS